MSMDKGRFLKKYEILANKYINDKDLSAKLFRRAFEKLTLRRIPVFKVWKNLQLLLQLFNDWITGNYKEIPRSTLVAVVAGILYFVSPVDIILDIIPFGGFIDDAAVIAFVLKQSEKDIKKYLNWRNNR
jgi:uncharacterized membrane protein YkvA (DUF1232 family)